MPSRRRLIPLVPAMTAFLCAIGAPGLADASITLVTGGTSAYYNQSIGTVLDRTNPVGNTFLFPGADVSDGDPTFDPVPFEPNLGAASSALGNWLGNPANLNANWSFQAIPATWAVNTETAIVYRIDAGAGLLGVVAQFGVDNGIFIWLDGVFQGGQLRPGGSVPGEFTRNLGDLGPGVHYLQVLREDHGVATGYDVQITAVSAVPEPATTRALFVGALMLGGYGWRKGLRRGRA